MPYGRLPKPFQTTSLNKDIAMAKNKIIDPVDITNIALQNAAQMGFEGLNNGEPLCQDNSSSASSEELKIDLAARQIEHCLEAWNFLSQATWALLNSQDNQAVHMSYYAEVRSAGSLLAATGIAQKSTPSYFLRSDGTRAKFTNPTHQLIRDIWPAWTERSDAREAFEKLQIAPSITLKDIFEALNLSSNSTTNALKDWGFELTNIDKDHTARNDASYNVQYIYDGVPKIEEREHTHLVYLIWQHLIPSGDQDFQFEKLYAQYLMHTICTDLATEEERANPRVYDSELESILVRLSNNKGIPKDSLESLFPLSHDYSDERFDLFTFAQEESTTPKNIYCRAFVLTRLATSKLVNNIELTKSNNALKWIKSWLEECGTLNNGDDFSNKIDSVEELQDAVEWVREAHLRELWINGENALNSALSCQIKTGICWALPDQL
jgi:hypothetical protein